MVENTNHARLIYIAASAVTAFYLHCTCILMAGSKSTTQQWTDQEIETLQYFIAHISEISETGNFKRKTYTAAAETMSTHSDPWSSEDQVAGGKSLDLIFETDYRQ